MGGNIVAAACTIIIGVMVVFAAPPTAHARVDVGVNINIGPPPIVVAEPPEVVLVPRSRVYFVPNLEFDVFFHDGYWWSPRGDRWYRSRDYKGPWRTIERRYIPTSVIRVPRDYRTVYVKEKHIPYGQWKKERHRDRREYRKDRREHYRDRKGHGGHDDHRDHDRHNRDDHRGRGR